jgi:hypothetical protein
LFSTLETEARLAVKSIIPNSENTFAVYALVVAVGKPYCPYLRETETMNADEQVIAAVLAKYQDALNRSNTNAVMNLYTSDGVFMPQHFPSSVGAAAVRKAYDVVFEAITLSVKFEVAEIMQVAPDWAIAPGK